MDDDATAAFFAPLRPASDHGMHHLLRPGSGTGSGGDDMHAYMATTGSTATAVSSLPPRVPTPELLARIRAQLPRASSSSASGHSPSPSGSVSTYGFLAPRTHLPATALPTAKAAATVRAHPAVSLAAIQATDLETQLTLARAEVLSVQAEAASWQQEAKYGNARPSP